LDKIINIQVHRNIKIFILILSTHLKNERPLLTIGITTGPIHHKKSTYYSSPYGLLQIQFAANNLRTTPVHTDYCRSNSSQIIYVLLQSMRITADPIRHKKSTYYF